MSITYSIGIYLPAQLQEQLASLGSGLSNMHWVEADDFHILLRHLDVLQENTLVDVKERLSTVIFSPFPIHLYGMDYSSSKSGQDKLWVQVIPSESVIKLKKEIDKCLGRLDLPPIEKGYKPHVLLGKGSHNNPNRIADYLMYHNFYQSESIMIDGFSLLSYQSTSTKTIVTQIEKYSFVKEEKGKISESERLWNLKNDSQD